MRSAEVFGRGGSFRTNALVVSANLGQVQSHTYTHPADAVRTADSGRGRRKE